MSHPWRSRSLLALAVTIVAAGGCGTRFEAPPLEASYRQSLVGAGNILQLKNQSNEALLEVEVTIRAASGEVVYTEEKLAGYEVLEVGWKKLGGFEIPDDARIEVKARGYLLPVKVNLDAAGNEAGAGAS